MESMTMKKKTRLLSLILSILLMISVLPYAVSADETEHPGLLGRTNMLRPSEGGSLAVTEIDGKMTLTDENGQPIQLRGMSTHGLQWFGEIINENAFAT